MQGIRGGMRVVIGKQVVREGLTEQVTLEQRSERDQGGGCSGQRPWWAQRFRGWWGLAWFFTCLSDGLHQPEPMPVVPQSLMPTAAAALFGYLGSRAQLAPVLESRPVLSCMLAISHM